MPSRRRIRHRIRLIAVNATVLGALLLGMHWLVNDGGLAVILANTDRLAWALVATGLSLSIFLNVPSGRRDRRGSSSFIDRLGLGPDTALPEVVVTTPKIHAQVLPARPKRPSAWDASVFDMIEWRRFEALMEALHRRDNFDLYLRSHGPEVGADIRAYLPGQFGVPLGIVRCLHARKTVGADAVQDFKTVMTAEGIERGQFVTTARFDNAARDFAAQAGIVLLDRKQLLAKIVDRPVGEQAGLLNIATEGEFWRPTCVKCGVKLTEKVVDRDGSSFWGCATAGCRTVMRRRGG